jgi:hypothetical protein|tara:strand:- start:265 stop:396 length:132 start_codon:yes stop_codon:yes gene_type:complete
MVSTLQQDGKNVAVKPAYEKTSTTAMSADEKAPPTEYKASTTD